MNSKRFYILPFRKLFLVLVFFIFNSPLSYSQKEKSLDTLVNWSYAKLLKEYDRYANFDSKEALIYSNAYLKKAKTKNDTIRIANAFSQIVAISKYSNKIKYCDSIIYYTKDSPSKTYPSWGYLNKGIIFHNEGNNKKALDNCSKGYLHALKQNNQIHLFYLNQLIGQLKLFWGDPNDAINIYKNQLKLLKQNKKLNSINNKISIYSKLSNAYIINMHLDSAYHFNKLGLTLSLKNKEINHYVSFVSQSGEILFNQKKYYQSRDSLLKTIAYGANNFGIEHTYSLLGQIEHELGAQATSLAYFKQADSIIEINQDYTPETKTVYNYLRDYYLKNGDAENLEIYSRKLRKTDSILTENYKLVNKKLVQDFEIPKIVNEKDETINILRNSSITSQNTGLILIVASTFGAFGVFFFVTSWERKRKQKRAKKPIEKVITGISPEVVNRILKKLEKFEVKKQFTNNNLDLKKLASKLNTNSAYLSKIINVKKEQSVTSYLNNLRIDYCLEQINSNKKYQLYDVKSLAIEFGFNTAESFTKAFVSKTGNTPGSYIQKLKN